MLLENTCKENMVSC